MKAELDFAAWGPRDYVKLPFIHPDWRVVDIGPGSYPLKRANVFIDHNQDILDAIDLQQGQQAILDDLQKGLPEIPDDAFNFAFISHVLEHCIELQTCINTLNRIAKRGVMVVPSSYKESIFNFEESDHRWDCLPNPTHGKPPVFVERNVGYVSRLKDQMVQKATCFLYRTGTQHDCTAERHLRAWYQEKEPMLDIVHTWDASRPLEAVIIR